MPRKVYNKKYDESLAKRFAERLLQKAICTMFVLVLHLLFFVFIGGFFNKDVQNYYSLALQKSLFVIKSIKVSVVSFNEKSYKMFNSNAPNFAKKSEPTPEKQSEDVSNQTSKQNSALVSYLLGSQNNPAPNYPPFALQNGLEGLVEIEAEVFVETGVVKIAVVAKSSGHEILNLAAKNTISKWRFNAIQNTAKINTQDLLQGETQDNPHPAGQKPPQTAKILIPINFVIEG